MFERFYRTDTIDDDYRLRPVEGYPADGGHIEPARSAVRVRVQRLLLTDRTSDCAGVRSSSPSKHTRTTARGRRCSPRAGERRKPTACWKFQPTPWSWAYLTNCTGAEACWVAGAGSEPSETGW
jgi:hypothetical protein